MRVNLLIAMIIFALIWPATALRAAVSKTTWADAPAREFVFVENNSDDNFFVTPGGALDPRLTLEIFDRPLRSLNGVTKLPHQAAGVFGRPGQPVNGAESDPDVKSLHYLHSRCEVPPAHAS